jgi:hypothetical protein
MRICDEQRFNDCKRMSSEQRPSMGQDVQKVCVPKTNVDPDDISAIKPYNDEAIKQFEADGWDNEQIHGGNVRRVITQEGLPSLAGRPPPLDHVLGNA